MEKLKGQSQDLEKHSIEKIKELFPEVVTEGKVDFEKLRHILGDEVDESNEKYQFTWNGKSQTIKLAQKPSNGTLIPSKTESKDWDTTENLYIEGDNLEVLKQLQKTYFGKIKMIYIDPPYNTGGDFVYKDDFKDSIKNYKEQTNQTSRSNADTSGRYHTDWLNMMYSRLLLAKNLLTDDGVIFVSIDDHELYSLQKILVEIFGETNFLSTLIWLKKRKGSFLSKNIISSTEYIIVLTKDICSFNGLFGGYASSDETQPLIKRTNNLSILEFDKQQIEFKVDDGILKKGLYGEDLNPVELLDDLKIVNSFNTNKVRIKAPFIWSQKFLGEQLDLGAKLYINTMNMQIRCLRPFDSSKFKGLSNFIEGVRIRATNEDAYEELSKLFESRGLFDYSKPSNLIKYLIKSTTEFNKSSLILDFFSGSATTAHAVMKMNSEDNGNRKFIMVQLPEKTDEKSEAYKAGYKNICEIGKERIRRAGEQIKQEMEKEGNDSSKLDIGFKVFKLDDTNIKEWDSSQEVTASTLFDQKEVFKEGRTTDDVLYEILLKYGVFDMPISETLVNSKVAYDIGQGDMVVALFDDITAEDVRAIGDLKPRVVIFKDSGFKDENVKLNALHNLQRQGVEDVKSI